MLDLAKDNTDTEEDVRNAEGVLEIAPFDCPICGKEMVVKKKKDEVIAECVNGLCNCSIVFPYDKK